MYGITLCVIQDSGVVTASGARLPWSNEKSAQSCGGLGTTRYGYPPKQYAAALLQHAMSWFSRVSPAVQLSGPPASAFFIRVSPAASAAFYR